MKELSSRNLGLFMAYLLPGFTAIAGWSGLPGELQAWLHFGAVAGPTVGGFLYVTVASAAAGFTISVIRWALVDSLHALAGITRPTWNDLLLTERLRAYQLLIELHYYHYQFCGNMFVALLLVYVPHRIAASASFGAWDIVFVLLEVTLLAGSRDALQKYYRRVELLLAANKNGDTDDERRTP